MTIRKLFLLTLTIVLLPLSMAHAQSQIPVFQQIYLCVRYIDPNLPHTPLPKSPVQPPYIGIDDHTIYFVTPCDGCILQIVNEDGEAEYISVVPTNCESLELPAILEGEYEIQIIRGDYCYYGYIEL